MARDNKASVAAVISNQEILAEVNLISQIQQIETRLATEPDSIRFAQLADAYLGIGDFDHAISLCEKGLVTHPQYDTGTLVLAKSYYLSGNKIKAREILQDFLITHPASLAGHKLLGDLSLEEDDVAGTVSHYRIALRFDPINRQIIQTLVDLKDKYQKIKDSKTSDDEEEEVKTVVKKSEPIPPEKPIEKAQPVAEEKSVQMKEDSKLDSFIEDAIQPVEDKMAFKPIDTKPVKTEPIAAKTPETPMVDDMRNEFHPAYTNEHGIMYFYDDDEVSFEQYKKRLDLQKAGKALILERAQLDQKLAEKGIKTKAQASEAEVVFPTADMDITTAGFEIDKKQKAEPKKTTTFEEHIDESMAKEEEELLSAAEQEAALSEIEISYKDYLDILTSEDELLEALFQEEHEAGLEDEKEDKATRILASALKQEEDISSETLAEDLPIAYLDYVQSLEDDTDIEEASFVVRAVSEQDDDLVNFNDFSSYLNDSDDTIDFNAFAMMSEAEGITLWDEEPTLDYNSYIASATDVEKTAALFDTIEPITEHVEPPKEIVQEPVIEEKAEALKIVEEKIDEIPAEQPVMKAEAVKPKEETRPAAQPEINEEPEGETEEFEEEEVEEEINPQDATPELVEKLASRGQYGSAYKVCKMLKVKNPTDAKVDRKILELKRLYVWSSQMVG